MWSRASNRQHPSVAKLDERIQTFTGSRCELKSFWIVADIHIQSKNILHIISDPTVYQKAIQSPLTKCFAILVVEAFFKSWFKQPFEEKQHLTNL